MRVEGHSGSQPGLDKPPSTPEMSTRDVEAMANAMLLDSPLPNLERANEEIPRGESFQEKEKVRSFWREAMINSLRRPLHVSL